MAHYNGDIKFRGTSSKAYPLIITTPPQIGHGDKITEDYTIPGRNGTLISKGYYRASATISVTMALVADEGFTSGVSKYKQAYRQVMSWLQGSGKLIIGDSADSFYEVQKVEISTDERVILRYGNIEALFTVYPYEFLNSGDTGISGGTIVNTADKASPLYKITGSGSGSLTVNNNVMTYSVDGELYIDTRRLIAYDSQGRNCSNNISGDYTQLRLVNGSNSVSASAGNLTVYPKWGYNI